MKGKKCRALLSICLIVFLLAGYAQPFFADDTVDTVESEERETARAIFYVLKPGNDRYKSSSDPYYYDRLGAGVIEVPDDTLIEDEDYVLDFLMDIPSGNQEVSWFRMKFNTNNRSWWVFGENIGEVYEDEEEAMTEDSFGEERDGPVTDDSSGEERDGPVVESNFGEDSGEAVTENSEEEATEPVLVSAVFYVLKSDKASYRLNADPQFYTRAGIGAIAEPDSTLIDDSSEIEAHLETVPSLSAVPLGANETVSWYRMRKMSNNGQWWIFGEIVEDDQSDSIVDEEAPAGAVEEEPTAANEVSARVFVLKPGNEKYRSNNDPQFYTSLGTATIAEPTATPMTDSDAILERIFTLPDFSKIDLAYNEEVIWYRLQKMTNNGQWWLFGEIAEIEGYADELPEEIDVPELAVPLPSEPETQPETLREFLYYWLTTGNEEVHDISHFNYKFKEVNTTFNDMIADEGYIAASCSATYILSTTAGADSVIQTVQLKNLGSDFLSIYTQTLSTVNDFMDTVDPRMNDMEKMLLAHDFIVDRTVFAEKSYAAFMAYGPLAYGYAVCNGYTLALQLLAHEMGIETYQAVSAKMNHAWVVANIDGSWYHIDPTWNYTRSIPRGAVGHYFFVRSDSEFRGDVKNPHYGWDEKYIKPPAASSQKYKDWFVHDVVGQMYYHNELWYFLYKGDLVRSSIDGRKSATIASGADGEITFTGVENGYLYYAQGGQNFMIEIDVELVPLAGKPPITALSSHVVPIIVAILVLLVAAALLWWFYIRKRRPAQEAQQ